ncbi:MAG: mechanosensitive ion channel family protein [Gammaproteobacteria bacterium]|nr:mechanosensitive ion channel family protein [Gammaproteobacteria bacterium]
MDMFSIKGLGTSERIVLVLAIAAAAHLCVRAVRHLAYRLSSTNAVQRWAKLRTLAGLTTSILVFSLYFGAIGLVLREFGVSLTAYLASASVLGLAIGFGSQGLVQDVVTGLTVIFSDLFQVGDLVKISGETGTVQSIGMRFTALLNPLGAQVYIPNRTLANVIVYPRGYLRCFADITLSAQEEVARQMLAKVEAITVGFVQQFPGILRAKPEIGPRGSTPVGRVFVRVKFRIWPDRSGPIEGAYKQEIVQTLKTLDTEYADWMVSINTEVSETTAVIPAYRAPRNPADVKSDESHADHPTP